ncbi:hypothetical protein ACFL1H_02335 [Nanoarchaeota archaeon]
MKLAEIGKKPMYIIGAVLIPMYVFAFTQIDHPIVKKVESTVYHVGQKATIEIDRFEKSIDTYIENHF